MAISKEISKRIEEWTKPPFAEEIINEIKELIKQNNEKELIDRFFTTLEFGTGGLRGIIGAGTNRMNIYTVGMATQGLANYIIARGKSDKGIVIARDSRRMSDTFSKEAASILAANGIKVYLFEDIMPTPICSFAVRELGTVSGIVITASHNPPEYNGYKVYWEDGGQIIPPLDNEIIAEVNKIDSISKIKKTNFNSVLKSGMIKMTGRDITDAYISRLETAALRNKSESKTKIVYSPMHGTGYRIIPEVLSHFGFNDLHIVEDQSKPDGNFPTVSKPNPEEKEAMELSIRLAKKINADIIMATDPDADRMGVGFKDNEGDYILINGNQIGTMLEYYILKRLKEENRLPENGIIVKTIVTSDLQDEIAESFNCKAENVLTGFKWIAKKMKECDDSGIGRFIFGGEESYGYLPVDFVRDKDAVSSCYFFAEMNDWLSGKGITLNDFLNEIYVRYNLYVEDLLSLTLKGRDGMEQIDRIMDSFRKKPPLKFADTAVDRIADIKNLTVRNIAAGRNEKIENLPSSNVLQFFLSDVTKITMRPSGTEPKIKFYFSARTKVNKTNIESKKKELSEKIKGLKDNLQREVEKI